MVLSPQNCTKKNDELGQSASTHPTTATHYDDSSSYYSDGEEFYGDDDESFYHNEGGGSAKPPSALPMSDNDISKMLGSVKFAEITADRTQTRSLSSNAISKQVQNTSVGEAVHRSSSMPGKQSKQDDVDGDNIIPKTPNVDDRNPSQILGRILKEREYDFDVIPWDSQKIPDDFFEPNSEENMKAYTNEILGAVRTQDVQTLKQLFANGHSMQCRNKFGESILHLACRRGFGDVVDFLIHDAQININIRDDFGRTPLHDVCWVTKPNFQIVTNLLKVSPDLFIIGDSRGFTPLQYVKKDQHGAWSDFLEQNEELVVPKRIKR